MMISCRRAAEPAVTPRRSKTIEIVTRSIYRALSGPGCHTIGRRRDAARVAWRVVSTSLLKKTWRRKERRSARGVVDGRGEPHGTGGRQRKRKKVSRVFRGSGAAGVVAPAFLFDGS